MNPAETAAPYLPPDLAPEPAMDERAFWDHCAGRHLMFQRCGDCGRHRHPPVPLCPACQSSRIAWTEAPAAATVYSYTIVHHPSHPAMRPHVPYNVVVLAFEGLDDVRFVSNVVDVPPDEVAVGLPVILHWEGPVGGYWLPRFRRAAKAQP